MNAPRTSLLALMLFAAAALPAQGRAVDVAIVGKMVAPAAPDQEVYTPTTSATLPAEIVGAFFLVEASVDGVVGRYILDSGAPGLILHRAQTYDATDAKRTTGSGNAVSIAGDAEIGRIRVRRLDWGALSQRGLDAYTMDLSHLGDLDGAPIDGIIGYAQLRATRLEIDYPARRITFLPRRGPVAHAVALPFQLSGHLPVVGADVNGRALRLGLDTGAGINLLDDDHHASVAPASKVLPPMRVRGLGNAVDTVSRATVDLTEMARVNWIDLPFGFADLAGFRESGIRIDGLIGKEWMARRVITIDYRRRRIYVR